MSTRFRIRTSQGQELSFGSEEMFADFVKSGDLSAGDLVYDAATGEWSPALTHSLVLGLGADAPSAPGTETAAGEHGSEPDLDGPPVSDELGLDLAPGMTPDEAAQAFVRKMEAERASDMGEIESVLGLKPDEQGTGFLRDDIQPAPALGPRGQPPTRRGQDGPVGGRSGRKAPPGARRAASARPDGAGRGTAAKLFLALAAAGVLALAIVFGADLVPRANGTPDVEVAEPEVEVPVLEDTEEALAGRASIEFIGRALASVADLPPIPGEWLEGRYLANASAYPIVRDVWVQYLDAARRFRVDEADMYSAAYLTALQDAGVTGANRTLRLAAAMSRFEDGRAARDAHYQRIADLATAAIDLHDLLLEMEDDITYEPAVGSRVSADPVLEAAGRDPLTQQRLEAALDRTLDALSARGQGPIEAPAVPAWTIEGLRAAVVPE
jgi:hypothetical protein